MIEKYQDNAALAAAGLPQGESRVALVADGNRVAIDGVNVEKCIPSWADPIYVDTDGYTHIIDKETFDASLIPEGWSYKGPFAQMRDKDTVAVFMGDFASLPTEKYLDVCQYAWTDVELDGAEHTKSIGIRTALGWAADTTVNITYTATTLAEAAAAATAAIEAALIHRTELVLASPDLARVVFAEELFQGDPEVEQILFGMMQRHHKVMLKHFREAIEAGEIRGDIPMDTLFRLILGPLRMLIKQWGMSHGAFDLRRERKKLLKSMKLLLANHKQGVE